MFDFHAHKGADDSSAFISIVREPMVPVKGMCPGSRYSFGCLPWHEHVSQLSIEEALRKDPELSVGECGLDRRYPEMEDLQRKVFREQLELARDYDRLVVIHSVGRYADIIKELSGFGMRRAVFHGYTSSYEMARDITRKGWWISLGERSLRTRDYRKLITLPFLLETDMPTGPEEKEAIRRLYEKVSMDTGIDQEKRLDDIRKDIWQQKDSF